MTSLKRWKKVTANLEFYTLQKYLSKLKVKCKTIMHKRCMDGVKGNKDIKTLVVPASSWAVKMDNKIIVVQTLSCIQLFATPWTAACQASLSLTISWSLLKLTSIESMMPSNHLILCRPLLLLPSIFPSMNLFQWVSSSHQLAKVLELQHQAFWWIFKAEFL